MPKKRGVIASILLLLLIVPMFALAQESSTEVFYFHSESCSSCKPMFDFLTKLGKSDSSIVLQSINIDEDINNKAMLELLAYRYNIDNIKFPIVFIDNTAFVGYNPRIKDKIAEKIEVCKVKKCYSSTNVPLNTPLNVEVGETSYIELYKTGSGVIQGVLLVALILFISFLIMYHKKASLEAYFRKKARRGRGRATAKASIVWRR